MPADDITRQLSAAMRDPTLMRAALALHQDRLSEAEPLLRAHLKTNPFDVAAIRMLAELAGRIGRLQDAEILLRRVLDLSPDFGAARVNYATVLYRTNRPIEALAELDRLDVSGEDGPRDDGNPNLRAAVLNRLGEFEGALALYEDTLMRQPDRAKVWLSYGHVLKTVGRLDDGVAAYRRAIALQPGHGEAWWSLANLKTVGFTDADRADMTAALTGADLTPEDRFHLEFALGKAWEDAGDPARAFASYADANTHRRALIRYDAGDTTRRVDRMIEFFPVLREGGCPASDPIFIVGLPRSGSTLVEQILASHSQVEAIAELPDIPQLWTNLGEDDAEGSFARFSELSDAELREIGEAYLERVAPQRKTDRPYFIDKLPNNWLYIGFIKAILPHARIIDARRHGMSVGFANFRQHFARGQHFAYDLQDIGQYYRDYLRLMDHFNMIMPAAIHHVSYEHMVEDSEGTIRTLLAALGLPFEDSCLKFYANDRPVRTPSSQQVRSAIYQQGTENWQSFEAWLGPLGDALG